MEKWEYKARLLRANIEHHGVKEYLRKAYPDWKPSKYSPEAMEMYLNQEGEDGWEVIHIEPIFGTGKNDDIYWQGGAVPCYSNAYFCLFKRRKPE